MSLFHVETTKTAILNNIEYSAKIEKDITIIFSAAHYNVKIPEDAHNTEIELIPDNMDFLHELTDIFPTGSYDIKIKQSIYRHLKPHISLHFDISHKKSGEKIYFAEGVVLSDDDYDYIRDILIKEVPQYKWQTAENFLRTSIERYMSDSNNDDLFSDDAWDFLIRMTSARYKEYKTDRYIDFDTDLMKNTAREILGEALLRAYKENEDII